MNQEQWRALVREKSIVKLIKIAESYGVSAEAAVSAPPNAQYNIWRYCRPVYMQHILAAIATGNDANIRAWVAQREEGNEWSVRFILSAIRSSIRTAIRDADR